MAVQPRTACASAKSNNSLDMGGFWGWSVLVSGPPELIQRRSASRSFTLR
jgi:hypothetical protein